MALRTVVLPSFLLALFLGGCATTGEGGKPVSSLLISPQVMRVLIVDRHDFGHELWSNASASTEGACAHELAQRRSRLLLKDMIQARSKSLAVEFASVFYSLIPEALSYLEFSYLETPLKKGFTRALPLAQPSALGPEQAVALARKQNVDLVLALEWVALKESIHEDSQTRQINSSGTKAYFEQRNVKTNRVEATCGFRLYDGTDGRVLQEVQYSDTLSQKHRTPINCDAQLAKESRQTLENCFRTLVRNLRSAPQS